MSLDRELVDTIKATFARRSSAHLQEVARSDDRERWSPEAVAAANEVLADRAAGRAEEPVVAEEEPPPPAVHYEPSDVAFAMLAGLFALGTGVGSGGFLFFVPRIPSRPAEAPDVPVRFGTQMAWVAVDSTDTRDVAAALGLREVRAATWADGIKAAYQSSVFVTPPLGDWTLAVGTAFFPPDRPEPFVKLLLEPLSARFGEAQYFCTHRDIELHLWARARNAQVVRGFGWLGQKRLTLWDEGKPTRAERDLRIQPADDRIAAAPGAGRTDVTVPSEEAVTRLASLWSIDPTSLDYLMSEPATGLLGTAAWADTRIKR